MNSMASSPGLPWGSSRYPPRLREPEMVGGASGGFGDHRLGEGLLVL
jgi:hypothetical protein